MTLPNLPLHDSSFTFGKNIFYQKELPNARIFEKNYIELRQREKRIYSDEIVRRLPDFDGFDTLKKEWAIRKITCQELIRRFKKRNDRPLILELGCGNGWLSHQLAISLNAEVLGLDINETELLQGASVFNGCSNLAFVCADVFMADIKKETFDVILLASSIQYFPNLGQLIHRLFELLNPSGEIHIVDSPIYRSLKEAVEAKKRSRDYFCAQGVAEMANNYFHHTLPELESFTPQLLFKPDSLISMIKRKLLRTPQSPFPWIMIKHP